MSKAGIGALVFAIVVAMSIPVKTYAQEPSGISLSPDTRFACSAKEACIESNAVCVANTTGNNNLPKIIVDKTGSLTDTSISLSPTIKSGVEPTESPTVKTLDSNAVFFMINVFREKLGLPKFEKEDRLCEIASERAKEIPNEVATGKIHEGFYARNLPYFAIENAKYGGNEREVVDWWLHSPIHKSTIVGNMKYSCVACTDTSCSEIFSSFEEKVTAFNVPEIFRGQNQIPAANSKN